MKASRLTVLPAFIITALGAAAGARADSDLKCTLRFQTKTWSINLQVRDGCRHDSLFETASL
ncbi:MAG: hypothetical protein WDM77_19855 [Steroidobacteraceae bacterium]